MTVTDVQQQQARDEQAVSAIESFVGGGGRFEAFHDLPDLYRREAARMMEFHMMSEIVGPVQEFFWVPRSPSLEAKLIFAAKSQDEVGHGLALLRVCEDLTGKTRGQYMEEMLDGPPRFMNIFHYPWAEWVDPAIVAWLIDGAEIERQTTLLASSYAPYARAMKKIVKEEGFHHHAGRYLIEQTIAAGAAQKAKVQAGVERWWSRTLAMFGPPDSQSTHGAKLIRLGLKLSENEKLRQSWLTKFVPQIEAFGLDVPDEQLAYDEESGVWSYTMPDWDEFRSLLRGGSPVGEELQRQLRDGRGRNGWLVRRVLEEAA